MIDVVKEDEEALSWMDKERCCFCRTRTQYWNKAKDVAVCTDCAKTHDFEDLPTKEEWCAKEKALTKSFC